jgi:CTP synthase
VGKYVSYEDSYKSLNEALVHGGIANDLQVNLDFVESEKMEGTDLAQRLGSLDGILVPGGFGIRGVEGMIRVIEHARSAKIPYFGICLGMQTAFIEFARNKAGLRGANSTEFDEDTPHRVIYKLRDLLGVEEMGGTMRLGSYPCRISSGSAASQAYGCSEIGERHRHRYEVNQEYLGRMVESGLLVSGLSPDGKFVEIIEIEDHPWYVGCQFHPEYRSKPLKPHPLFRDFISAAFEHRKKRDEAS